MAPRQRAGQADPGCGLARLNQRLNEKNLGRPEGLAQPGRGRVHLPRQQRGSGGRAQFLAWSSVRFHIPPFPQARRATCFTLKSLIVDGTRARHRRHRPALLRFRPLLVRRELRIRRGRRASCAARVHPRLGQGGPEERRPARLRRACPRAEARSPAHLQQVPLCCSSAGPPVRSSFPSLASSPSSVRVRPTVQIGAGLFLALPEQRTQPTPRSEPHAELLNAPATMRGAAEARSPEGRHPVQIEALESGFNDFGEDHRQAPTSGPRRPPPGVREEPSTSGAPRSGTQRRRERHRRQPGQAPKFASHAKYTHRRLDRRGRQRQHGCPDVLQLAVR